MHLKKLLLSLSLLPLLSIEASEDSVKGLYNGLDPTSISQHLALHKLYPQDPTGQQALEDVKRLLSKAQLEGSSLSQIPLSTLSLEGFISFMLGNKIEEDLLEEEDLKAIERLSAHLSNRSLKGYGIETEDQIKELDSREIDFSRALLIAQQRGQEIDMLWTRNYEAQLDFMALQILARLPKDPTTRDKIKEINKLIFFELRYRYPALSALKAAEEPFSKLTTVLDSKKGLCLGTSILYLSLAQRVGLPLEVVIPPGHIFVRHVSADGETNIETTARGINYPTENYLNVNTKTLKTASLKEVIGFVFYNLSSTHLVKTKNYSKAIETYLHCLEYAPDNLQAQELLGYAYLLNGEDKEAKKYFKKLEGQFSEDQIASVYLDMHLDYLKNKIGKDAIEAIVSQSDDESLKGIKEKQEVLKKVTKKYPKFKAGLFFLAETYQSLSQSKKAIEVLERVHKLDSSYPYVEYMLSSLYLYEYNFPKAWKHFKLLEEILTKHDHHPKMLKDYKNMLMQYSIEP